MISTVAVSFPYAANGITVEQLEVGDARDFGALTDGLTEAGLIEPQTVVDAIVAAVTPSKKKK